MNFEKAISNTICKRLPKLAAGILALVSFAFTSYPAGDYRESIQAGSPVSGRIDSIQNPGQVHPILHSSNHSFAGKTVLSFSHERGYYNSPFYLTIVSNNPEANIIYTIDCSTPTTGNGLVYNTAIRIDSTTVLKVRAFATKDTSELYTNTYLFSNLVLKQPKRPIGFPAQWGGSAYIAADYEMDPFVVNHPDYTKDIAGAFVSVPSLLLSMDMDDWFEPNTGLYVGYPDSETTREKKVSAEFIFPGKNENISIECGVQNQGGTSIVNWKVPKQSMRLLFKEIYGPGKLKYKLFPDSEINSINTLVVDGFLYSWLHPWDNTQRVTSLYFRDQLASDLQNQMGWQSFHGIYVNLFINGLYWGIYDLHERPDEDFMSEHLGFEAEDYDIIKHDSANVVAGSNEEYLRLLKLSREDLSQDNNYKAIQEYLDLDAFIDYMILNFYLGNFDWAHQNYYAARNHATKSGFRFYTWDAEHVMRYSDVNYDNTLKNDKGGPTEIHTRLKANPEYRLKFADAVYRHLYNDGALTPENFERAFLFRKNEIEKVITLESARWGDYLETTTIVTYTKNGHWLPEVNKALTQYVPLRRDIVMNQFKRTDNKLFPTVMPPLISEGSESNGTRKFMVLTNSNTTGGSIYYTTDGADPRLDGGITNGILYSSPVKLSQSTIIKARFKASDGAWSALAQKLILFDVKYGKGIVISEIMYHPEDDYPEFIELMNTGESTVNLKGFSFSNGIGYSFLSDLNIQPGAGVVLANDSLLFREQYGFSATGQFVKKLSNEGETLLLSNCFGQVIDSVAYTDSIPWPMIESDGYSIELSGLTLDNALGTNWKISKEKNGSPFKPGNKPGLAVHLYPNPFTDFIFLKTDDLSLANALFTIGIYNQWGSQVYKLKTVGHTSEIRIPSADWPAGLYVIRIEPESGSIFENAVIKAVKLHR